MEDVSDDDMLSDAKADAEERDYRGDVERDSLLAQIAELQAKRDGRKAVATEVASLEERFADDPDNEKLRLELHVARVKAGWSEFRVDTASGVDPRTVIPWVTSREVIRTEEWAGPTETPDQTWLRPVVNKTPKIGNHRICDDGKWRRDVVQKLDVVAVEDLAHLCSIVKRMEDVILTKSNESGLQLLTIFDQRMY